MVPLGTGSPSVSDFVALVEKRIRASHLKSTLHSAGTTIEGPWDEVMNLIGDLHEFAHASGYVRVHTDIRVGSRTDKVQTAQDKMDVVNKKLAEQC
ncbi:LAMI_0C07536g1_1 [Lachancea mirantina]|uniref:LAMI_0C07536g1_1 n=1 Tax=Lachancea mirantina TaxID=1230905 RepID=A0A1G4J418_9SACH|nr:LAMI_0C07536g1_1 [Lachancea mirantina]